MLSNVYSQHNVYTHNSFLLIQGKARSYEQFHVYYSNYMNDESNDQTIKRLKTNVKANIFFEFMLLKYEVDVDEDLDLNVKEYELYKNSLKLGNNDDKEEDGEFNCEDQMGNFLPYYYKATTNSTDKKDAFDLALCHYVLYENKMEQHLTSLNIIKINQIIFNQKKFPVTSRRKSVY